MNANQKEEYLVDLLTKLEQPHMVFNNRIFVLPTTSPMFELLPSTSLSNSDFGIFAKTNDDYVWQESESYTLLLIDLNTYEINKIKDAVDYITSMVDKI